jgi:hypothetical protein
MKKFFYASLLAITIALSFSACTEEQVEPSTEFNGGGSGSER